MRQRNFIIFSVFALFLSANAFLQAQTSDTSPSPPIFLEVSSEENVGEFPHVDRRRLWAKISISNPARSPFILRITFNNGGSLMSWFGNAYGRDDTRISLVDLELRYRAQNEVMLTKKFADITGKSEGFVYEVEFLPEDMQVLYNMELWGRVHPVDAFRAGPGMYYERLQLELVETKPMAAPFEAVIDEDITDDAASKLPKRRARRLRKRR